MSTEKTDAVIVGMGAAGGILAAELAKAGMKVIGLERGPRLNTSDFTPHDELRYFQRRICAPAPSASPLPGGQTKRHVRSRCRFSTTAIRQAAARFTTARSRGASMRTTSARVRKPSSATGSRRFRRIRLTRWALRRSGAATWGRACLARITRAGRAWAMIRRSPTCSSSAARRSPR